MDVVQRERQLLFAAIPVGGANILHQSANIQHRLRTPEILRHDEMAGTLQGPRDMYRTCIAVADASRARIFTYDRSAEPEGLQEHLVEERDLVNPARRLRAAELFSDSRPGTNRTGSLQYAFDDHRDDHVDELDAEFSRTVIDELISLVRTGHAQRVILCASPRMLGELRRAGRELPREGVVIDELARDLVKLPVADLRQHLASHGLLGTLSSPARLM